MTTSIVSARDQVLVAILSVLLALIVMNPVTTLKVQADISNAQAGTHTVRLDTLTEQVDIRMGPVGIRIVVVTTTSVTATV